MRTSWLKVNHLSNWLCSIEAIDPVHKRSHKILFSFFLCFLKGYYSRETECMNIKLRDCLMFISTLKINFIPPFFLEILQRCWTCHSGYFGHVWLLPLKRWYQLAENFNIYFLPKNQIYSFPLSWNIAKMLKTYYFFQKIILTCRKLWFYLLVLNQDITERILKSYWASPFWFIT